MAQSFRTAGRIVGVESRKFNRRLLSRLRGAAAYASRHAVALEARLELHAPDARLVQEAGEVIEIDAADDDFLVGDIATEGGYLVSAVVPVVADTQAAL